MKKIIKIQILLFCFCTAALVAQPKLEITDHKFDFGSVSTNSIIYKHFWFKSTGSDTLIITNIKTGCACALMEAVKDTLPPGDSMKVGIEWKIGNRIHSIGRYPYIYTNASDDPYRIYLTGKAYKSLEDLKPVSIKPYKFEFSKYKQTSIDEIKFTLTNNSSEPVSYQVITDLPEECVIELPETIAPNSKAEGKIKVKKEYLDKEFKASITMLSLDNKETKITIPIRRKIFDK